MTLKERDRAIRSLIVIEGISRATQYWMQRGFCPDDKTLALIQKAEENMIESASQTSAELLAFA